MVLYCYLFIIVLVPVNGRSSRVSFTSTIYLLIFLLGHNGRTGFFPILMVLALLDILMLYQILVEPVKFFKYF